VADERSRVKFRSATPEDVVARLLTRNDLVRRAIRATGMGSPSTIDRWVGRGELPPGEMVGGSRYWTLADLLDWGTFCAQVLASEEAAPD
jgi:predicted DNA-binding transcriptional regulator AlpA